MTQTLLSAADSGHPSAMLVFGAVSLLGATWFIVLIVRPGVVKRPMRGDNWSDHEGGRLSDNALDRRRLFGLIGLIVLIVIWLRMLALSD